MSSYRPPHRDYPTCNTQGVIKNLRTPAFQRVLLDDRIHPDDKECEGSDVMKMV
jgi:hypothetical protein